jgi:hypothetical protein
MTNMSTQKKFTTMNAKELEAYVSGVLDREGLGRQSGVYIDKPDPTPSIKLLCLATLAMLKSTRRLEILTIVLIALTMALGTIAVIQVAFAV